MKSLLLYRELIRNLVVKDLKIKYRDSTIGFLWSLANPLLLIIVYTFVFNHILKGSIPNYTYFLLIGILPWNFFAQSVMMSTGSILENGGLIRKVAMPMEVFPVATVLFNLGAICSGFSGFRAHVLVIFSGADGMGNVVVFPRADLAHALYRRLELHDFDGDGVLSRRAPFCRDRPDAIILAHADYLRYWQCSRIFAVGHLLESAVLLYSKLPGRCFPSSGAGIFSSRDLNSFGGIVVHDRLPRASSL
jgi:hypothetical protein